jgi:hypothetical protein
MNVGLILRECAPSQVQKRVDAILDGVEARVLEQLPLRAPGVVGDIVAQAFWDQVVALSGLTFEDVRDDSENPARQHLKGQPMAAAGIPWS